MVLRGCALRKSYVTGISRSRNLNFLLLIGRNKVDAVGNGLFKESVRSFFILIVLHFALVLPVYKVVV